MGKNAPKPMPIKEKPQIGGGHTDFRWTPTGNRPDAPEAGATPDIKIFRLTTGPNNDRFGYLRTWEVNGRVKEEWRWKADWAQWPSAFTLTAASSATDGAHPLPIGDWHDEFGLSCPQFVWDGYAVAPGGPAPQGGIWYSAAVAGNTTTWLRAEVSGVWSFRAERWFSSDGSGLTVGGGGVVFTRLPGGAPAGNMRRGQEFISR